MLRKACPTSHTVVVADTSTRNGSTERAEIRSPTQASTPNSAITRPAPSKPSSSPMIAKMKSLWALGR